MEALVECSFLLVHEEGRIDAIPMGPAVVVPAPDLRLPATGLVFMWRLLPMVHFSVPIVGLLAALACCGGLDDAKELLKVPSFGFLAYGDGNRTGMVVFGCAW